MVLHVRRHLAASLTCLLLLSIPGRGQQDDVNARIREEGFERSRIMETLHHLTDVFGPRLTGSPSLERAGEWALNRMASYGLVNTHTHAWEWGHPGWENEVLVAHMVSPAKVPLVCEVVAWTPSTDGTVTASAVHVVPPPSPTQAELDTFLGEIKSQVSKAIVLVGTGTISAFGYNPPERLDDEQVKRDYEPTNIAPPRGGRRSEATVADRLTAREVEKQVNAVLKAAGTLGIARPAERKDGIVTAFGARSYDPEQELPTVVMANQDYGRITRLLQSGHEVQLELNIVNRVYPEGRTAYNYIAEIAGTDKSEEVILLGGHLDSWHGATGATDNATGSAVMIEAVRILQALGLRPRRTIRVALWSGEEQGLLGSLAYVKDHFGTFETPEPAYEKLGGYVNVDMGTGKLRGAAVFGSQETAQVLEDILSPFEDLGVFGARPVSVRALGGSDHTSFNQAGLPGISMGQDPIRYFSHTWHTNLDTYEQVLEDDVKQAAVVVAALAYHLATREELLPRFSEDQMPAPVE